MRMSIGVTHQMVIKSRSIYKNRLYHPINKGETLNLMALQRELAGYGMNRIHSYRVAEQKGNIM